MKSSRLIGTYTLVSWENRHESGKITYPLGPDAQGVISYSPDGYVFVHVMAKDRKHHSVGDLFGGEISEIKSSATSHISYCGTFEATDNEVVHHVTISSFPNWVPSEQRRNWEFKSGHLLLSAQGLQVGNERVGAYLIWQRATPQDDI
ncbi:MAG: lipocalin-like domain-containing protein [Chloroflexota bacterium]|nr:MAG: lipocalin-like domain-containing protein [Chloroflexota bacterium]